jgi:hypothetical protein
MTNVAWSRFLPSVAAFLVGAVHALEPGEFVAGWSLEVPAEAEVFDVPLTAEILAEAGVEQLAVLDGSGAPQPFFRRAPDAAEAVEEFLTLEASPLYATGSAAGPAVGVTTTDRGTAVTVRPRGDAEPVVAAFVLDVRDIDRAPEALELHWRSLPQPFLLEVEVDQSDDLTTWRRIGRAAVAALSIGGSEVRHARVPVRATRGGYLRIRAVRTVEGWYVERADLVSAAAAPAALASSRLAPLASDDRPRDAPADALFFDARGALPVAAVALDFGRGSGWSRADLASAPSLAGPWTPRAHSALFYALDFEGERFASPPIDVGRSEARFWRVVPAEPLRGAPVELLLEYPEERLRVAARGAPPYLLAAGTLSEAAGPDRTFAAVWQELPAAEVSLATLGTRRELGGAAALVAPWSFPWRAAALWTVLGGGVLVVGFMAVRLAREMQNPSS